MASEMELSTASAADLVADMEAHRSTYAGFFNLLKWSVVGFAIVLTILFFALN
ncbi:MAG: aa3-type cytochrome c oxidase subunit IV [Alphaproteobacteria bacterium]